MSIVTRLADAAEHQREAIAFVAEVDEAEVDVDVVAQLPDSVREHMSRVAALREQAAEANEAAARESRAAAAELVGAGIPLRDVGAILGVSHQRAHQLASTA
jgi:23S rRNA maturation-related 3'-5' exoribonuclease YhaM